MDFNQDPIMGVYSGGGFEDVIREGFRGGSKKDLIKALTGAGGTDHATLTGGAALRRESIEASLMRTTQREEHLVIWRKLPKSDASALVDEWTRDREVGGVPMSGFNAELAAIPENTGTYEREFGRVKLITDMRRVSGVAEDQSKKGLADAIATETDKGSIKVLTDANSCIYYGDSACNEDEFDGLDKQLRAIGGDAIIDLRGESITGNAKEFIEAARRVWGFGHWGKVTDYFCSGEMQTDIDQKLDPAHRVSVDGSDRNVKIGTPVKGIHTNFGDMATNIDPFLLEGQPPFIARGPLYAAFVTGSGVSAPVSVAGVAAPNAASKFLAAHVGAYYWAVEAGGKNGKRSALVVSAAVNVAAGDRVTVTITAPVGNNARCYYLFRSRRNGTNAAADLREMVRLPANGDTAVVYLDDNQNIPGSSIIPVLSIRNKAIDVRRMGPQRRIPLYPSDTWESRWAQVALMYLRLAKENQHVLIINAVPSVQAWRPF